MLVPRWRNMSILKNSITASSSSSSSSSSTTTTATQFASFHSTPVTCVKWKNKWNNNVKGAQQPSKNYIRYAMRQKRADAKRALKDLLYNSGSLNTSFQPLGKFDWDSEKLDKKGQSKFSRHAAKPQPKKKKCKIRRDSFSEDDNDPETVFHATFGKRWSTWYFNSFRSSTSEFEWRDQSNWSNHRTRQWDTAGESESDDDSCTVGSSSDRTILGLPPTGPLKIEDVKNAFRSSALKWHPDKHRGPSQAIAAEKFKVCVNAYKSLCNAFA